jgi:acetoacetate decarboxylase
LLIFPAFRTILTKPQKEEKMQIDRSKINIMPLIRGPMWEQAKPPKQVYARVESIMLEYETDPDAIPPFLPEPYKPGKSPIVTVLFNDCNGVDFMAGGGYRMGAVAVAAQFDGEAGHLDGSYVLVMPENSGLPIMTGREWLGMPKFQTDISAIRMMENGSLRCEVSMWGHYLFGIEIKPAFRKQNIIIRKGASSMASRSPSFGYKYIASLDGPPDADYPTVMWNDINIEQLWLAGGGNFEVADAGEAEIGDYAPVIRALKTLPVRKIRQASHWFGSMVLRNDKNGRLRSLG